MITIAINFFTHKKFIVIGFDSGEGSDSVDYQRCRLSARQVGVPSPMVPPNEVTCCLCPQFVASMVEKGERMWT